MGIIRNEGYHNQDEGGWMVHPNEVIVGRALPTQCIPLHPQWDNGIMERRIAELVRTNSLPIDMLSNGDIYVADGFGKIIDGTLVRDNLGNSYLRKPQNGIIFHGSLRDIEGLEKIDGFNAWMKGYDSSYIQQMMLSAINSPVRLGRAIVLPDDVVLAKKGGVIFIPLQCWKSL